MSKLFCKECNNMMYPREDTNEKVLLLACKCCEHFQESHTNKIYYKSFKTKQKTQAYAKDLASDPTLPRTKVKCAKCLFEQAVYFQSKENEEDVALFMTYVCCRCYHTWE